MSTFFLVLGILKIRVGGRGQSNTFVCVGLTDLADCKRLLGELYNLPPSTNPLNPWITYLGWEVFNERMIDVRVFQLRKVSIGDLPTREREREIERTSELMEWFEFIKLKSNLEFVLIMASSIMEGLFIRH